MANDFRREIRKLIAEGKSDQEILDLLNVFLRVTAISFATARQSRAANDRPGRSGRLAGHWPDDALLRQTARRNKFCHFGLAPLLKEQRQVSALRPPSSQPPE